ncbi:aspartic peptidase A1 [Pholiota conissans]|uniref:Aspartic peptidase A1 n=1 Tax=Pholiota conissans TaxID=109636 RepID=A0A9P5ZGG6_9AGAR|nr:aspartic peptidase A1 [Pholiota conissans]
MLFLAAFTALALLFVSASASILQLKQSPVTLSLARRLNLTSAHNLVRHDQARAKYLGNRSSNLNLHSRDASTANRSEAVDNQAVTYIADISVGIPPIMYSLIVDTGSSNTWVGANTKYSSTSGVVTGNVVDVQYGSGEFAGIEVVDTVSITPSLVIAHQSIGVAKEAEGFDGIDGIIGIGPAGLTKGTLLPAHDDQIPTITDNLYTDKVIADNSIGIFFHPTNVAEDLNGQITWGGVDNSKYTGDITYIPITKSSPASDYWGIDQSITYGSDTPILSSSAGIVDTGTTLIMLTTDAFNKYKNATGAVDDQATGLLSITPTQYANLSSLFFISGGTTFELVPNAQIFPRTLNTVIGGTTSTIYLMIADLGSIEVAGLAFINGYAFLERFYSVYDTTNKRVGLATTPFTNATTN